MKFRFWSTESLLWMMLSVIALTGLLSAACTAATAPPAASTPSTAQQPAASAPSPTAAASPSAAPASEVTVTDVVGRKVTVKQPVERAILSEGRMMYVVAALDKEDPFKRVVGWVDDLRTADFDAYEKYQAKFPSMANAKVFGSPSRGEFSAEQAVALKPDVFIVNLDSYPRALETGLLDQLATLGVPSVVTDFRQFPLENTVPSMLLLGKVLGQEERAQAVVDYYLQQVNLVYSRLSEIKGEKTVAFMLRAAGLLDCCGTFGRGNLGLLVERAGGTNFASDLLPAWNGTINPEKVLAADPAVIIATGSNWTHSASKKGTYISLGYKASAASASEDIAQVIKESPGWENLSSVKNGRFHAIWHQFYNSPYHFAALQQFAKWLYPEEFKDLDPEKALREFHEKFLPIEYSGVFWGSHKP